MLEALTLSDVVFNPISDPSLGNTDVSLLAIPFSQTHAKILSQIHSLI